MFLSQVEVLVPSFYLSLAYLVWFTEIVLALLPSITLVLSSCELIPLPQPVSGPVDTGCMEGFSFLGTNGVFGDQFHSPFSL